MIAEKCEVSRSTVSLALRGDPRISTRVITLVRKTALALDYTPDPKVAKIMSYIAKKNKLDKSSLGILLGSFFDRPDPWNESVWLHELHRSLLQKAEAGGYGITTFWLGEKGMSPKRIKEIMINRGIEGLIVIDNPESSGRIEFDFTPFASVVIGHGLPEIGLDSVGGNLHQDMLRVLSETTARDYHNPGLVLEANGSMRNSQYWTSAYCYFQSKLSAENRIPFCLFDHDNLEDLGQWYDHYRPDVIISASDSIRMNLEKLGIHVSEDTGFATLLQNNQDSPMAGISLPAMPIASRAIDLVADKLRRFERGVPPTPEVTLFEGTWREGASLPARMASLMA